MSTFNSDPNVRGLTAEDGCTHGPPIDVDVAYDMVRPVVRLSLDHADFHKCVELNPSRAIQLGVSLIHMAQQAQRGHG